MEEETQKLLNILNESVKRQMISDVEVGCFLSGGLDSSNITVLAARHCKKLKVFTAGFSGDTKEIEYAKQTVDYLNSLSAGAKIEHHNVVISPRMFVDALPELIGHYDQPISFASSVGLHFVSRLAEKHGVRVILTGEGSDELFAGYSRYKRLQGIFEVTNESGFPLGRAGYSLASKFFHDPRYLKMIELICLGNNYDYLTGVNSIVGKERDKYLLKSNNNNRNHPLRKTVKELYNSQNDTLNKLLYLDWNTYLQELLIKQDRMSMSASIESRVPFLDNEVIDFANSIEPDSKLNEGIGKYILREAAKDILPPEIIKRKKIGFTVPLDDWFRGPLYEYMQKELDNPIVYKFFTKEYVTTLLEQQLKHNCSLQLWAILNFKIWYKMNFKEEQI